MSFKILFGCLILVFFSSCKIADLSQPTYWPSEKSNEVANQKLEEVIETQGFDILKNENIYSVEVTDHWKGLLGKMAKIWDEPTTLFSFKFNFNTFDGNALLLSGKHRGDLIGLQSWMFYEKKKGTNTYENKDTGDKHNPKEFGLATLHYFIELPYRLYQAPIKKYYGQKEYNNKTYDLIFVSWKSVSTNKNYDQYIIWINTHSKLIDYCVYMHNPAELTPLF